MKKIFCYILTVLTLIMSVTIVHAADEPAVTVTGEYSDNLNVVCDNSSIFEKNMVAPGDSWSSTIKIQNNSPDKSLDVSLKSIDSVIEDLRLYNVLNLQIYLNQQLVYDDMYNAKQSPIINWVTLAPSESKYLQVVVSVPANLNNDYQALKMNSQWIFECRTDEPIASSPSPNIKPNLPIKTGVQYMLNNPAVLIAFVTSFLAIVMVIIYYIYKKKKRE